MTDSTHELSPTDRAILAAFRELESPPPGAAARVYRATLARIESQDDVSPPVAPAMLWVRSIALSFAIAAAVLLAIRGVVTGASALREQARAVPAQAEHGVAGDTEVSGRAQKAKPPKPTPAAKPDEPAAAAEVPAAAVEPEPTVQEPPTPRAAPARADSSASDLAADLELLAEAKRTADPTPRLSLLERHAKAHPRSTLAEERDVLIIEALCALGRTSEARTKATRFAERHPRSAFHARVQKSCVSAGH